MNGELLSNFTEVEDWSATKGALDHTYPVNLDEEIRGHNSGSSLEDVSFEYSFSKPTNDATNPSEFECNGVEIVCQLITFKSASFNEQPQKWAICQGVCVYRWRNYDEWWIIGVHGKPTGPVYSLGVWRPKASKLQSRSLKCVHYSYRVPSQDYCESPIEAQSCFVFFSLSLAVRILFRVKPIPH